MKREISAGIIIYRKDRQEVKFLLLYHGNGYWNFPKGKLESEPSTKAGALVRGQETSFHAALREVREETGLGSHDLKFKEYFKVYNRYVYRRGQEKVFKVVIYYLAETRTRQVRVSLEHEGYGWFLYKEALRLLKHPSLRNILRISYDAIRRKNLQSRQPHSAR